jgi:hypothetical protein
VQLAAYTGSEDASASAELGNDISTQSSAAQGSFSVSAASGDSFGAYWPGDRLLGICTRQNVL